MLVFIFCVRSRLSLSAINTNFTAHPSASLTRYYQPHQAQTKNATTKNTYNQQNTYTRINIFLSPHQHHQHTSSCCSVDVIYTPICMHDWYLFCWMSPPLFSQAQKLILLLLLYVFIFFHFLFCFRSLYLFCVYLLLFKFFVLLQRFSSLHLSGAIAALVSGLWRYEPPYTTHKQPHSYARTHTYDHI